jgi:hypothetical protein
MSAFISFLYGLTKAVPAAKDIFFGIQDLYFDEVFKNLSTATNDYTGRLRAISNSIENAHSNDDLVHLSVMLAELQSSGHRESTGTPSDTTSSPE